MNVGPENTPIYNTALSGSLALNTSADTAFPDVPCEGVWLAAPAGNSVPVYINTAAAGTTTGFPIVAGASPIFVRVDNLSRLGFAYAGAAAQTLRYLVLR